MQLESNDSQSGCLDCVSICFVKHVCKGEAAKLGKSETSRAKAVDGEVPCLFVIDLELAFRY